MPAKQIVIKPLTGYLDLRSEPEDVPVGGYRWAQNFQVVQKGKACRLPGWSRLMDRDSGYNNFDFHHQLFTLTGQSTRLPTTFLFEAESSLKQTMLLLSTREFLMALNVGTGNYRLLSATYGDVKSAAQNGDTIVLTNDADEPKQWVFGAPDLEPISDLVTLGITKVGTVVSFRGFTFYMNIVEDGHTYSNRMLWSDLKKPLSLIPGEASLAGDLDLDTGESILGALPLANSLIVYTTRGIWQVGITGGEEVFGASKRYDAGKSSEAVLAYPRTLVTVGDTHIYAAQSGIYEFSFYESKPKLVEWIHRASSVMFDELDPANCAGPVFGVDAEHHHIWISWTPAGQTLPQRSLVLNTQFPFSTIVDHGFTAFCQFMPREPVLVLRDWIMETCICTPEELEEFFDEFVNEGGYCEAPTAPVCEDQPDAFYTTEELELEDGIVMEDFTAEEPSENSLCARLNGQSLADLCLTESQADQCNAARLFVMASAEDLCLKQTSASYYREVCTGFDACGTYEIEGYKSILRSGPLSFKNFTDEKRFDRFMAEFSALPAVVPGQVTLRVGASAQALDPNVDCGILWQQQTAKVLNCLGGTEASHDAANTRPDLPLQWPIYWQGMNLYFELTMGNANSNPIDTGAAVCFSKFVLDITPQPVRY